jgi:hypothetical protein
MKKLNKIKNNKNKEHKMALTQEQLKALVAAQTTVETSKVNSELFTKNGTKVLTLKEGDKGTIFMNPTREGWMILRMKNEAGVVDTIANLQVLVSKLDPENIHEITTNEVTASDIDAI